VENKISKLLDLHLEDQIDKENYEEKYTELKKELQELKTEKKEVLLQICLMGDHLLQDLI